MAVPDKMQQIDLALPEVQKTNDKMTEKDTSQESSRHRDTLCGIGTCAPSGVQRCANIALFTASAGVASLCLQTLSTYFASQVTSLEKQFGLSSTDSGVLVSCNDIGFLSTVLIFSHFGRKGHIPRILAMTGLIYGLAGIACGLSQFIEPGSLPKVDIDGNSSRDEGNYLCTSEGAAKNRNQTCAVDESRDIGSSQWVVYMLGIALVLQGICKSPRTPLSTVYVDNNVRDKMKTGLYLGVITTLTLFGPAFAFTLGGVFSRIPVDLQSTPLTPTDTRWIGAWWLGFLVFGGVSLVLVSPLVFFPRRLKGSWMEKKYGTDEKVEEHTLCQKIKGLPASVLRVLRSPIYTLSLCAITLLNFTVGGYVSFGPKYLENVFVIPAWQANVIQGIQAAISIGLGTFFGGYLTTRFKLNPRGCLKFVVGACALAVIIETLNFIFGCPNLPIIGIQPNIYLAQDSGTACDCSDAQYLPVCGASTQTTYFSPCHAGCRVENGTTFGECSFETGRDVTLGMCDTGCPYLYPFVVTSVLYSLVGTLSIIPAYIIMLRSVQDEDKSMAIGILSFTISLLGFLPAPIVYGKVIDTTCRVWNFSCGIRGSCALYDIVDMRMKIIGMDVGLRGAAAVVFLAAFLFRKYVLKSEDSDSSSENTDDTKL